MKYGKRKRLTALFLSFLMIWNNGTTTFSAELRDDGSSEASYEEVYEEQSAEEVMDSEDGLTVSVDEDIQASDEAGSAEEALLDDGIGEESQESETEQDAEPVDTEEDTKEESANEVPSNEEVSNEENSEEETADEVLPEGDFEEELSSMPVLDEEDEGAQSFLLYAQTESGIDVYIDADEGVIPDGTTAEARDLSSEKALAIAEDFAEEIADARGFEIVYYDQDGNEFELPEGTAVRIRTSFTNEDSLTVSRWEKDPFHVLYQAEDGKTLEFSDVKMDEYGAEFTTDIHSAYVLASIGKIETEETTFTAAVPEQGLLVSMLVPAESLPYPAEELTLSARAVSKKSVVALVESECDDSEDTQRETVLFDIALMHDGEEVEPLGPVVVTFSGLEVPNDDAQVFHVEDDKKSVEEMPVETTDEGEIQMETDHFSLYAVTYTVESYFRSYTGETFKITVSFDEDAGIPSDAELFVRELIPGTDEYASYKEASAEALGEEDENQISFARFFDIELRKDGEKIEPNTPVEIKIEYEDGIDREDGDILSIVHFADDGTEVIRDVKVNGDGTEIVYEQDSLSVTATVLTAPPAATVTGSAYALVVKYEDHYYNVHNDGTLQYVEYNEAHNTIEMGSPALWTYISDNSGNKYLRYISEGYDPDWSQRSTKYTYAYIDPRSTDGISVDQVVEVQNEGTSSQNTVIERQNPGCAIVIENGQIRNANEDLYIAVDEFAQRILGAYSQNDPDHATQIQKSEFFLAKVKDIPDIDRTVDYGNEFAKNHYVDHIDISVRGTASFDYILPEGEYYDSNGNLLINVTSSTPEAVRTLNLTNDHVVVSQENVRKATIIATDKNTGEELSDVFYITGYSHNEPTDYTDAAQVRIEGLFKVANLDPLPEKVNYTYNYPAANNDRLNNRILYTVSATEPVKFDLISSNGQLYDKNGHKLSVAADVTITDSFDYFDKGNECPPLMPTFFGNDNTEVYNRWQSGAIENPGNSGMDFKLQGTGEVTLLPVQININKNIVHIANGKEENISLKTPLNTLFNVYQSASASSDEVAERYKNGEVYQNYNSYTIRHSDELTINTSGSGSIFDSDVTPDMTYISEDKASIPGLIEDTNDILWSYKNTYIDTEYVWRKLDDERELHHSKIYTVDDPEYNSIPEILGPYDNGLFNGVLSFTVTNVYEEYDGPSKTEIQINGDSAYKEKTLENASSYGDKDLDIYEGVKVGDEITYEIAFKNYKAVEADVVVNDALDKNLGYISAGDALAEDGSTLGTTSLTKEPSVGNSGTVEWTIKNVPAGAEGTVTLTVKVLEGAASTHKVDNQATVQVGINNKYDQELWTNEEENPVPEEPKKNETKTAGADAVLSDIKEGEATNGDKDREFFRAVKVGDEIIYNITFKNYKTDTADVVITDQLDPNNGLGFIFAGDAVAADGSKLGTTTVTEKPNRSQPGTVIWTISGVPSGAEGSVELTAVVLDAAVKQHKVDNQATVKVGVNNVFDQEFWTNEEENPVPDEPVKHETAINGTEVGDPEVKTGEAVNPEGDEKDLEIFSAVKPGDEITYEISQINYKTQPATVKIVDVLDENVELVTDPEKTTAGFTRTGDGRRTLTWNLDGIAAGEYGEVKLTVKVLESAVEATKVDNQAKVSVGINNKFDQELWTNEEENPVPEMPEKKEKKINAADVEVKVTREGKASEQNAEGEKDLEIFDLVKPGDEITYEISQINYKKESATVKITDILDPNLEFVSSEPSEPVVDGQKLTWELKDVEPGDYGTVALVVKVKPEAVTAGKVDNQAKATVDDDTELWTNEEENPVPKEPSKTETKTADKDAVLELTKTGESSMPLAEDEKKDLEIYGAVRPDDTITYEIAYKNYKSETATVKITDELDKNVTFVSAKKLFGRGNCELENPPAVGSTGTVTYVITGVPAGAEGTVQLVVQVEKSALRSENGPGKVDNQASVQIQGESDNKYDQELWTNEEENPLREEPVKNETKINDASANVISTKEGQATESNDDEKKDLEIFGSVRPGDKITYVIKQLNYKADTATVEIVDTLDANVALVEAETSPAVTSRSDDNDRELTWKIENVKSGEEAVVTLVVEVLDSAVEAGKVDNQAKARVGIGNNFDGFLWTNEEENPVPEEPQKREVLTREDPAVLADVLEGQSTKPTDGKKKDRDVYGAVKPGDTITYEISYNNYKNSKATVVITDELDPNVTFVSADKTSGSGIFTPEGVKAGETGTAVFTITDVEPGDTGVVKLVVRVEEGAVEKGKVDNQAYVEVGVDNVFDDKVWTNEEENPVPEPPTKKETKINADAAGDPTVNEDRAAEANGDNKMDLEIYGAVKPGDEITYEITQKNYKTKDATVRIIDTLDENVELVADKTTSGYTASGEGNRTLTWLIDDVEKGKEAKVTLVVKVKESALKVGYIDNQAKGTVGIDNNFDQDLWTNEEENPIPIEPEKTETKTADEDAVLADTIENGAKEGNYGVKRDLEIYGPVKPGDKITYVIDYKNYKRTDADIVISDVLDPNVTFVSAQALTHPDNCMIDPPEVGDTGEVIYFLSDIPAGEEGQVELVVKVEESALESHGGPAKVDNQASVKVGVDGDYDLELWTNEEENPVPEEPSKKETFPDEGVGVLCGVKPGDKITYEISYKNYKSQPATVTIEDKIDDNVKFVEATEGGDITLTPPTTEKGGNVKWTIENVPAGYDDVVSLTVEVLEGAKGKSVVNGGDSTSVQVDHDPVYHVDTVENPVPDEPYKTETETAGEEAELAATLAGEGGHDKDLEIYGAVKPDDLITYEITYKNYKDVPADVRISDELDPNVVFEAVTEGTEGNTKIDAPKKGENGIVEWVITSVPADTVGTVTLTVKVLESALVSQEGPGKVDNQASVKVGFEATNKYDQEMWTNEEENPVPEKPSKKEIFPDEGTGALCGVKVGDRITYEITFKNYKTRPATVKIADQLDPKVRFLYATLSDIGDCELETPDEEAGGTVYWTIYDVPAGETGSVELSVEVLEGAKSDKVVNGGKTTTVQVDNDSIYDVDEVENPVPDEPYKVETMTGEEPAELFETEKSAAPHDKDRDYYGAVKPGDTITYEITFRNYKQKTADVRIEDVLDPNVVFESAGNATVGATKIDAPKQGEHGTVTWTILGVPAGESGTVELVVKVLESALESKGGPGKVDNQASTEVGFDADNNYDSKMWTNEEENPVPEKPSKKETSPDEGTGVLCPVNVGDEITYEITYKNYKTKTAYVSIFDELDPNVAYVKADTDGTVADFEIFEPDEENGGIVEWILADVPAGHEGKVTLTVRVLESASNLSVVNGGDTTTVRVGNDSAYSVDTVENPVPEGPVKKETKTGADDAVLEEFLEGKAAEDGKDLEIYGPVKPDDLITYEISYRNYKNEEATVEISDELDKNVTFVKASLLEGEGKCEITDPGVGKTGTVTWTITGVPKNSEGTVQLIVKVEKSALASEGGPGKVDNQAKVRVKGETDNDFDKDLWTNEEENPIPEGPVKKETGAAGNPAADPIVKTGEAEGDKDLEIYAGVKPGDEIEYEISQINYKSSEATVKIVDTLDPNVELVSAKTTAGFETGKDGRTITWTLDGIASGEYATVKLVVRVLESAVKAEKVDNQAKASVGVDNVFDTEQWTNREENPVPEEPFKTETKTEGKDAVLSEIKAGKAAKDNKDLEIYGAVVPGSEITYEISYKNYKPTVADVVITDVLDKNVRFISAKQTSGTGTVAITDPGLDKTGTVTWTITGVPAGERGTVELVVRVHKDALVSGGGPGKVDNQASSKVGIDNNWDQELWTNEEENPVPEKPVKTETKTAGETSVLVETHNGEADFGNGDIENDRHFYGAVKPGDEIEYVISQKNYKTKDATVKFIDTLDDNVELVEDKTTEGFAKTGRTLTWNVENVKAGETASVTLTVKVLEGAKAVGKVDNQAKATVGIDNKFDRELWTDQEENPVPEEPVKTETKVGAEDVTALFTKTGEAKNHNGDSLKDLDMFKDVKPGDEITYTIRQKNYKSKPATVKITDTLDPNVELVADKSTATTSFTDGTCVWEIKDVESGEYAEVTLVVKVLEGAVEEGYVRNQAKASVGIDNKFDQELWTNEEDNPVPQEPVKKETKTRNEDAVLSDIIDGGAAKGDKALEIYGAVKPGDEITYEIEYRNSKDTQANVLITDELDKNVTFVNAKLLEGNGTCVIQDPGVGKTGTVTWVITNVPAGERGKVQLIVKVEKSALVSEKGPGKVDNQASVQLKGERDNDFSEKVWTNEEENPVPEPPVKKETKAAGNAAAEPLVKAGEAAEKNGDAEMDLEVYAGVQPGDEIEYVISQKNYKTSEATVKIVDTLDENVELVPDKTTKGYELGADGRTLTWTIGKVASGEEAEVTLVVKVLESAVAATKVDNQAKASVGIGDKFDTELWTNEEENPVPEEPFKSEVKTAGSDAVLSGIKAGQAAKGEKDLEIFGAVKPGDEITYEITYKNYKLVDADVVITDVLDKNVTFVSAKQIKGTGTVEVKDPGVGKNGTVTWTITGVPAGEKGAVELVVKVEKSAMTSEGGPGKVDNQASSKVGIDGKYDQELFTNEEENPVPEPPVKTETKTAGEAAVLSKTLDGEAAEKNGDAEMNLDIYGPVLPGDEIEYTISQINYKNTDASVKIVDTLDDNVELADAGTTAGFTTDESGKTLTWIIDGVKPGAEAKVTLVVKVLDTAKKAGKVDNQAKASVGIDNKFDQELWTNEEENPVPENPVKTETKTAAAAAVLADTKTGEASNDGRDLEIYGAVKPGETLTYEISYKNYKAVEADVKVTDVLDKNVTFEKASLKSGNGTCTVEDPGVGKTGTVVWTIKGVPAGEEGTVELVVKVAESALVSKEGPGKVDNQAYVEVGIDDKYDQKLWTNEEENPVPEKPSKKEIAPGNGTGKLVEVKAGEEITYEITYKNYKNADATVTIEDKLDDKVKFVSAADGTAGTKTTVTKPTGNNGGSVKWVIEGVPADTEGKVELTVEVLDSAKGLSVVNGGDTTTVQVDNDAKYTVDTVENPVKPAEKKIEVTKNLVYDGEDTTTELFAKDHTFYVALFDEAENIVSDILPLEYKDGSSATVTFEGLYADELYVVHEVDKDGNIEESGLIGDAAYVATYNEEDMEATVAESQDKVTVTFANEFTEIPKGFYLDGTLTITKKVLGSNGKEKNSDDTFYAGIFADKKLTTLSDAIKEGPIVELKMDGNSEITADPVHVMVPVDGDYELYVAEVDKQGNLVSKDKDFGYKVTVSNNGKVVIGEDMKGSVTITNKEKPSGSNGGNPGGGGSRSVKTGDDTPIARWIFLMSAAGILLICAEAIRRRRRNR